MKAVLFDLFGTLVDNFTNAALEQYCSDVADALEVDRGEFRRGWSSTFFERSVGKYNSLSEVLAAAASFCSSNYSPEGLERGVEIRRQFSRAWLTPRPDATAYSEELRQRGFRIGLFSNLFGGDTGNLARGRSCNVHRRTIILLPGRIAQADAGILPARARKASGQTFGMSLCGRW